ELGQHAVPDRLGRDAGAVGDVEDRAAHGGPGSGRAAQSTARPEAASSRRSPARPSLAVSPTAARHALARTAANPENCALPQSGPLFPRSTPLSDLVLWLDELRMSDLGKVGGKNASLGEMIGNLAQLGVSVPGGFATTAQAYQSYLEDSGLAKRIQDRLATLDVEDVDALTRAGTEIRGWIVDTALPAELDQAIRDAYAKLCADAGSTDIAVAVRSSATAEDLPDASF